MTLVQEAENLWSVTRQARLGPGVIFPARMTVVQTEPGALLLHSPVVIDEELGRELAGLGEVRNLVAPNLYHNLFLAAAAARYPDARVWTAPGLDAKLAKKGVSLSATPLDARARPAWKSALCPFFIEGAPGINEVAFHHAASGSLVTTDLFFNIHQMKGWMTPWVLRMVGAYRRPAQSRLWRRLVKDADVFRQSLGALLTCDYERIVVAHGDIIAQDARGVARRAVEWIAVPELAAQAG